MSQNWNKVHERINFQNYTDPALDEITMNDIDYAIYVVDSRILTLDIVKLDADDANTLVANLELNNDTGVITVTQKNGATYPLNTGINKIVTNWDYVRDRESEHYQNIVLTHEDGTVDYIDLSDLISEFEFKNSDTIGITVDQKGNVTANILEGSIEDKHLKRDYLAEIKTAENNAKSSERNAQSYAIGTAKDDEGEDWREGQATDNAKYYMEEAKKAAESIDVPVATTDKAGKVKPDGETIKIDENGTITAIVDNDEIMKTKLNTMTNLVKVYPGEGEKDYVTYIINNDGTVTIKANNGYYNSSVSPNIVVGAVRMLKKGTYKLIGCPAEANGLCVLRLQLNVPYNDTGDGIVFTIDKDYDFGIISIEVFPRYRADDLIIKPMITTNLNATYDDFVSYTGYNGALNKDVATLRNEVDKVNDDLAEKLDSSGDGSNLTEAFTTAGTRANIATGEKHSVIFGKIAKFFGDLKSVAFSGSYNDLSNKPTIQTVNNGTLTIQKNGSNVATFTANQSGNSTANITVPSVVNNLTTTSTGSALDASRGKALNDALSNKADRLMNASQWSGARTFTLDYGCAYLAICYPFSSGNINTNIAGAAIIVMGTNSGTTGQITYLFKGEDGQTCFWLDNNVLTVNNGWTWNVISVTKL